MTSGQIKQSSEFSIPVVDLPPIPNLHLPENDKQAVDLNFDVMKIPHIELPKLEFTSHEQETIKLPEIHLKSEQSKTEEKSSEIPVVTDIKQKKEVEHLPTVEAGLALASPFEEKSDIQTDLTIPDLPKLPSDENEIITKPELLSTEQKYTITDTHFVQPPELPLTIEKETTENLESPPKLPDFTFELPPVEPISVVSKDTLTSSPPSFEDEVPTTTSKIVPAIEISTPPIKSGDKEVIERKSEIKKKSATLALCSCFGDKSNAQKEKTKTIAAAAPPPPKEKPKSKVHKEKTKTIEAPKSDLPEVDMPVPSSNISSTLKKQGSLRAPSNDLPVVDLTLPPSESVHLPAIHTHEKKRQAPKKPKVKEEKVPPQPTTVNEVNIQQTNIVPSIEITSEEGQSPVIEKQVEEEISPSPAVIEKQSEEQINVRLPTPPPVVETLPPAEEIKKTHTESKKHSSFEIKAPALNIPELDLSVPNKTDLLVYERPNDLPAPTEASSGAGSGIRSSQKAV